MGSGTQEISTSPVPGTIHQMDLTNTITPPTSVDLPTLYGANKLQIYGNTNVHIVHL